MRWLQSFRGPEVAHFGPLEDPLNMELENQFLKLKVSKTSTLTLLSFTSVRSAAFGLQIYFQKFGIVLRNCRTIAM